MASLSYSKTITGLTTGTALPLQNVAVIGNPISSVFTEANLVAIHESIKMFINLETELAANLLNFMSVVPSSGALFDAFTDDYDAFKVSPLQSTWSAVNANQDTILAKRRYVFSSPEAESLYVEVEFCIRGVSATQNTWSQRPNINFHFHATSDFNTIVHSKAFSVFAPSTNPTSTGQGTYTWNIGYLVEGETLYMVPNCGFLRTGNSLYMGRTSGVSLPNGLPLGVIIGKFTALQPQTPATEIWCALTCPDYVGNFDSYSSFAVVGAQVPTNYYSGVNTGARFVTRFGSEYRAVLSGPYAQGASLTLGPSRNYIAPYMHVSLNGTAYTSDSIFVISDPFRNSFDKFVWDYNLGGIVTKVTGIHFMQPLPPSQPEWLYGLGAYVLGIKNDIADEL